MSTLKVDSIQDKAGTGAPDFPNGITVSSLVNGKIALIEQQSASLITNGSEIDVNANTLVVPAGTYRVDFGCKFHIQSSGISGAGVSAVGYIRVTDNSNVNLAVFPGVAQGEGVSVSRDGDGGTDQYKGSFRRVASVTLASDTTVKLRSYLTDTVGGTGTTVRQVNEAYMIWEKI